MSKLKDGAIEEPGGVLKACMRFFVNENMRSLLAQDLRRRLLSLGFTVERDDYGNVIASEPGENPLLFATHMDTVQPGRGVQPHVDRDAIYSDGSTVLGGDCKAGIAAVLEALESIRQEGISRVPVQLVFTREEEIGLVGARNLDTALIAAKEAIVLDGGGPVSTVTVASPTHMTFDVEIRGRAAHAAERDDGGPGPRQEGGHPSG